MVVVIVRNGIQWKRIILTAGLITLVSVLTTLPSIVMYFDLFTVKYVLAFVSLHYIGCLFDPAIYFGTNAQMRQRLWRRMRGGDTVTRGISTQNTSAI